MPAPAETPEEAVRQLTTLIDGFKHTALLYLAVRTGIVDALAAEPAPLVQLAAVTGLPDATLARSLRALVALGVCGVKDQMFSLTEAGRLLAQTCDLPLRAALLVDVEQRWPSWQQLPQAVRTGLPVFERIHGLSPWAFRAQHPALSDDFNRWLALETQHKALQIVPALPLNGTETLADIGGGHGGLLRATLDAFPGCSGILFDLPAVVTQAESHAPHPRIQFQAGNFLERVSLNADVFLLKSVLHDWDDAHCKRILTACHDSMHHGQRLLVIERLVDDESNPLEQSLVDLQMLLLHGGRERTRDEYETLLNDCRFKLHRIIKTGSGFFILDCFMLDCEPES